MRKKDKRQLIPDTKKAVCGSQRSKFLLFYQQLFHTSTSQHQTLAFLFFPLFLLLISFVLAFVLKPVFLQTFTFISAFARKLHKGLEDNKTPWMIFQSQPRHCRFFSASRDRWTDVADISFTFT